MENKSRKRSRESISEESNEKKCGKKYDKKVKVCVDNTSGMEISPFQNRKYDLAIECQGSTLIFPESKNMAYQSLVNQYLPNDISNIIISYLSTKLALEFQIELPKNSFYFAPVSDKEILIFSHDKILLYHLIKRQFCFQDKGSFYGDPPSETDIFSYSSFPKVKRLPSGFVILDKTGKISIFQKDPSGSWYKVREFSYDGACNILPVPIRQDSPEETLFISHNGKIKELSLEGKELRSWKDHGPYELGFIRKTGKIISLYYGFKGYLMEENSKTTRVSTTDLIYDLNPFHNPCYEIGIKWIHSPAERVLLRILKEDRVIAEGDAGISNHSWRFWVGNRGVLISQDCKELYVFHLVPE